ncbi:DUF4920 domain-containing protein [Ferrimonas balearica]|uniref:DUF4920 domain-containing protein n=1 Tax=Ferrimonas balearica TaxID=44012 RepID=UPI001C5780A7|nr:DUF4920 domain-containing protein [Ferrimonas balearica]MBW3139117.1 DUF4920 domain-containing protein [Ferrimonas balearica]MBY6106179.1 DUF4920 domain-containing protein [Ferrimonas balearica]
MKRLSHLLLSLLFISTTTWAGSAMTFGSGIDASAKVPLATLMASPDKFVGKTVTIEGEITAVCQKRGCWMTLASDPAYPDLRVKVKDGVMEFPVSAKGQRALATGTLQKMSWNLEQTRAFYAHQAEEQGTEFDPASITEPRVMYQLSPTGVEILAQ